MSIALALLASLGWGVGDFLGGLASRRSHFWTVSLHRQVIAVAIVFLAALITGGALTGADFAWSILAGIAAAIVMPLFFKALSEGEIATVAPIAATVGAAVPVGAGVALGENPADAQKLGALLTVIAIALISAGSRDPDAQGLRASLLHADVLYGVGCGVGFAGYFVSIDQTTDDSRLWPTVITTAVAVLVAFIGARFAGVSLKLRPEDRVITWVGSLFNLMAMVAFMFAVREGLLSLGSVLSSLYPAVTVLLAALVLKERMTPVHIAGFVLATAGVSLIAAG